MQIKDVCCRIVESVVVNGKTKCHEYGSILDIPKYEERMEETPGLPFQVEAMKTHQNGVPLAEPLLLELSHVPLMRLEDWVRTCHRTFDHVFEGTKWHRLDPEELTEEAATKEGLVKIITDLKNEMQVMGGEIRKLKAEDGPSEVEDPDTGTGGLTNLSDLTKVELVDKARNEYGLDLKMKLSRSTMIATIQASESTGE